VSAARSGAERGASTPAPGAPAAEAAAAPARE
jgi:hypothetical protein